MIQRNQQLLLNWGLRFLNKADSFSPRKLLSPAGIARYEQLIKEYPKSDSQIGAFIGDTVLGNCFFNHLIFQLLEAEKLKTRCLRVTSRWDYSFFDDFGFQSNDLILIDGLDLDLFSNSQKSILVQFIDILMDYSDFIFLNIPRKSMILNQEHIPKSLMDILSNSSLLWEFRTDAK